MRVLVKKWGNSASVRIPAAIMEAAHLEIDAPVDVREEDGRIVIEPLRKMELSLETLIAGMNAENFHEEVEFGDPVGSEVL